jgi:hypothetical protein
MKALPFHSDGIFLAPKIGSRKKRVLTLTSIQKNPSSCSNVSSGQIHF